MRVTSLTPAPGSTEATLPAAITAVFDRELNAPSVAMTTFVLQRSGGDGSFTEGNEVAVAAPSVTVPLGSAISAVMSSRASRRSTTPTASRCSARALPTILDLGGNALDGEFGGTFPSGNGTAGGDFTATFRVSSVQPTLTSIQTNVFTPRCSGCHTRRRSHAARQHEPRERQRELRGPGRRRRARRCLSLQRVTPGNPTDSYLVRKLEGGPNIVGLRMPRIAAPLDQTTIAVVRQWISNGAPQ